MSRQAVGYLPSTLRLPRPCKMHSHGFLVALPSAVLAKGLHDELSSLGRLLLLLLLGRGTPTRWFDDLLCGQAMLGEVWNPVIRDCV